MKHLFWAGVILLAGYGLGAAIGSCIKVARRESRPPSVTIELQVGDSPGWGWEPLPHPACVPSLETRCA